MYRNHCEAQAARSARTRGRKPYQRGFDAMILGELRMLCNARRRRMGYCDANLGIEASDIADLISPEDQFARLMKVTAANKTAKVVGALRRLRTIYLVSYDSTFHTWSTGSVPVLRLAG